jgi:hypothetical protein
MTPPAAPVFSREEPEMIGKVLFRFRGRPAEAVLHEDGCWSCVAVPSLVEPLDILYSPHREGLAADGPSGRHHLDAAARWLRGAVEPRG